ncbi:HD domain-containing protein 2 [Selaginella moellendorffii]|uniref:HD domain-containing protein 2 n=1 Tax=Selaginella moellendorffii TaxID=88036 RepID=UPI000D1C4907|nr:HD domain-containing protein 2 [Selaginella moellendorffii]|eukprot:XP_024529927.1 HD domain-containing protein 2 [Selaginella moellendorffii]
MGFIALQRLPVALGVAHCCRKGLRLSATTSTARMALGDNGGSAAPPAPSSVIHFLTLCQRLKTTKRAGWLNRDVKNAESIADHMHRMAIMALIAADIPGIDKDRCVKMAVVHDIAEAIVGDITPADGIPKDEKSRRERAAIDEMCDILENGRAASEIRELWNEYESNLSPEAKLVKDLDKVEMILQALEYESAQDKELDDFFMSTAGKFQTDIGKAWAAEIVSRREKRREKLHAAST